jgi:hypothetical protein
MADRPIDSVSGNLQKALDDLRSAGENATGEVRAGIDAAVERLRDASSSVRDASSSVASSVTSRAQEGADQILGTLDEMRAWIQNATSDALDELQKEIDKRRDQLKL